MDKCFIVTTLLLVYLIAVVDSLVSYECKIDEEKNGDNEEKPNFRLKLPNDTIANTTSTKQYLCNVINNETVQNLECNEWKKCFPTSCSEWLHIRPGFTDCAMSNGKGIMYGYRDVTSASGETTSCLAPCISLADRQECQLHAEKENGKEVEKRYTLTELILVALCCLLMGVLQTTLVFVLYMKRRLRGCFSKDIKDVQGDSKQQFGSDMQFLTESVVVKKYDPKNPKSAESKNENVADETQYQSLISIQVGNDQQTYDELKVNEPRSDRQGHHYEHCRDSDIDGHNYFVLERENMSRESRAMNLGHPETHAEVGDEVNDSTLGTEDKQSDAAHEYFLLEHFENGHN